MGWTELSKPVGTRRQFEKDQVDVFQFQLGLQVQSWYTETVTSVNTFVACLDAKSKN